MTLLKGTIQHGQVVLPHPADLPDGTPVTVLTDDATTTLGIPDEAWPTDPEGIAQLLARMERVEPFDMTPAEEAEIAAWRREVDEAAATRRLKMIESHFE